MKLPQAAATDRPTDSTFPLNALGERTATFCVTTCETCQSGGSGRGRIVIVARSKTDCCVLPLMVLGTFSESAVNRDIAINRKRHAPLPRLMVIKAVCKEPHMKLLIALILRRGNDTF